MINKECLRYLDLFGTKCSFYTEQKLKLYTPLGGILSILSLAAGIFIFIYINMSSFKRQDPLILTSSIIEENQNIKFNEEKLWIPWKIIRYNNSNVNYSYILFPIINYYYKENNNTKLESKHLSYKLCNETSMVRNPENILIDSSLDQLYCIDMDDVFMGGNISSAYFYSLQFNLYRYKNDIDFDIDNTNCILNDKTNNYFQIIFYYPSFEFQEIDFKAPIKIIYNKNSVSLSKSITKKDQLYLRKNVLYDNLGLFSKRKIYKFWGYSYINKDFFFIRNEERKYSSKLYVFDIFIEQNTIYYYRIYKNIFFILGQSLPLINLFYNIFKSIAKVFKLSSINRKMTELLFENLNEKPNKYDNYIEEIKAKKTTKNIGNKNKSTEDINIVNLTNKDNSKNIQNFSSFSLLKKNNKDLKDYRSSNQIYEKGSVSPNLYHKSILLNDKKKYNFRMNSSNLNNLIVYQKLSLKFQEQKFPKKKRFVANKLFPFQYYLCAVFIKNIDLSKHRFCMSRKFIKVYSFLCQLFDISSYCLLQKEFNIVKNSIFDEKNIKLIEDNSKINVNSKSFMREMNDCIGHKKFNILGKNNIKRKNEKSSH